MGDVLGDDGQAQLANGLDQRAGITGIENRAITQDGHGGGIHAQRGGPVTITGGTDDRIAGL